MVHVELGATLRGLGHRAGCLALGADEQHTATGRNRVAHDLQGLMQQRCGLGKVDNVDTIAGAEDVRLHAGVPAVGLMTEVGACFQQMAHRNVWQSHEPISFVSGCASAGL